MKSITAFLFLIVTLGLLAVVARASRPLSPRWPQVLPSTDPTKPKGLCKYFDCPCELVGGVPMCSKGSRKMYCPTDEPPEPQGGPVCGDDDKEYESAWHLARESCVSRTCLNIRSEGKCPKEEADLCKTGFCGLYKCRLTNGGVPKCIDGSGNELDCNPAPLHDIMIPVCGSNGKTYPHKQWLAIEACESNTPLKLKHEGECGRQGCDRSGYLGPSP